MSIDVLADRYRLLQKVGEGSAAEVFRAMDARLGRIVAIKLLRGSYSDDPDFTRRLQDEARAVARLSHPNILTIFDYQRADARDFIVMEYAPGPDLHGYLRRNRPISEDEAVRLISQVLGGLAAAHRAGIVHRDLKPRNVLVSSDGSLKVGDFGVAKATGDAGLTRSGVVFGTPHYLAPEVARGDAATLRSDLYAVGVMLYEMLAGRLPFEGVQALSVAYAHVFEEPPPLTRFAPDVSPRMLAVVERAMRKDPAARYADAEEMLAAVSELRRVPAASGARRAAGQRAPVVHPSTPAAQPSQVSASAPAVRRGRGWLAPILLLLALAGGGGALAWGAGWGRGTATEISGRGPVLLPGQDTPAAGRERTAVSSAEPREPAGPSTAAGPPPGATANPSPMDPSGDARTAPSAPTAPPVGPARTTTGDDATLYASSASGDGLNLRERPAQDSRLLLIVPPGGRVRTVGQRAPGPGGSGWRAVAYGGRTGYVLAGALRTTRSAALAASYGRGRNRGRPGGATSDGTMFRAGLPRTGYYDTQGVDRLHGLGWRFAAGGGVSRGAAVVDAVVYFGSVDTYFYAVDARTGVLRWRYKTGGIPSASPAVAGDLVYFGSDDGAVYALDKGTGGLVWRFQSGSRVPSAPAVSGGVVYFGSWDTHLYAVDAATGAELWRYATGGKIASSPAVAGGLVLFGSDDTYLYAVDLATGQRRWRFMTNRRVYASPAVAGDTVYVGSWDASLYAVATDTGLLRWSIRTGGPVSSSAAVRGDTLYVGTWNGNLLALDTATGERKWAAPTGARVFSSPAVAGGTVYFGSNDGYLYAVDAETGERRWRYGTDRAVPGSPAVADGAVYFGSMDGGFYALR